MRWVMVALAAVGGMGGAGCSRDDETRKLLAADRTLATQHRIWRKTRQSLNSEKPNLNLIRSVAIYLCKRTRGRVAKNYAGPDKQEVLARLDALKAAYEAKVLSLIDRRSYEVVLKPGVTSRQVRDAFMEIDRDYRALEAMTPTPPE